MFLKLKSFALSIPTFHSSRICSLGIRLVLVCASNTESRRSAPIRSGSERERMRSLKWIKLVLIG